MPSSFAFHLILAGFVVLALYAIVYRKSLFGSCRKIVTFAIFTTSAACLGSFLPFAFHLPSLICFNSYVIFFVTHLAEKFLLALALSCIFLFLITFVILAT